MKLSDEQLAELAQTIADTADDEINCEQMLARAAVFIETVSRGEEVPASLRVVAQHLQVCPECREEIELLLAAHFNAPDKPA